MGLGASTTSAATQTVIASSAYNSNISALNGASAPSFTTLTVTSTTSLGATTINGTLTVANFNTFMTGPSFVSIHGNGYGSQVKQQSIGATGNVTHGLSYTPYMVHSEQSTSGSQSTGHDTIGSTTYHVTLGGGATSDTFAA